MTAQVYEMITQLARLTRDLLPGVGEAKGVVLYVLLGFSIPMFANPVAVDQTVRAVSESGDIPPNDIRPHREYRTYVPRLAANSPMPIPS